MIAVRIISRWLKRSWILIGDGGFACIHLGHACIPMSYVIVLIDMLVHNRDVKNQSLPILPTAWYNKKSEATFSDILAFVRRSIWAKNYFNDSRFDGEYMKIKPEQWESLLDQLSWAA
jgi:hypothetical protein